jgi:putative membrane protein
MAHESTTPPSGSDHGSGAVPDPSSGTVFAGGVLMGLANLVPGVSGGTMILALGLYDRFIESVAAVARLRPNIRSLTFIAILAVGLAVAIIGLATPAVWLVREHRWLAYSLFIGMTLGGVPLLWKSVRPLDGATIASIVLGFAAMAALAFGLQATVLPSTAPVLVVAGALAASSMILPGVSGSYILLIMGLYDRVVGSVRPASLQDDLWGAMAVIVPVGIGAVVGIGLLSNLLRALLERFERPSHGFLLGLLVGSVLGLWPFQGAVHPDLVSEETLDAVKELVVAPVTPEGAFAPELLTELGLGADEALALRSRYEGRSPMEVELMALELEVYRPTPAQGVAAIHTLLLGFVITLLLGGIGRRGSSGGRDEERVAPARE